MKKPKKNKPHSQTPPKSGDTGNAPSAPSAPSSAFDASTVRSSGDTKVIVRDSAGELEPVAGRAAVPVLLILLLGALVYFGDMYIVEHGGQLDARVHQPFRMVKDLEDLQPKGKEEIFKARGRKIYNDYCTGCHQPDGGGNPSNFVPPLAGSDWVTPNDPSRIIRIVLNGLSGPITVNNKQYGQTAMTAWRTSLDDEAVAAVLTHVRSSWGNKAPAVNPDDVKKIREETVGKGEAPWTAEELLSITLKD